MALLAGRTAVITGGAQGLGYAIAQQFIAEGARVMVGDLNIDATRAAAESLGGSEVARARACDVTSGAAVDALVAAAWRSSAVWTSWSTTPVSPATRLLGR